MTSVHVGTYIEGFSRCQAAPSTKQSLAAIRQLFDWLAPMLDPSEARQLLDRIEVSTPIGLRDRALIGLTVYSFARVNAAVGMKIKDAFVQKRRL